jgi:hypothetical protein
MDRPNKFGVSVLVHQFAHSKRAQLFLFGTRRELVICDDRERPHSCTLTMGQNLNTMLIGEAII